MTTPLRIEYNADPGMCQLRFGERSVTWLNDERADELQRLIDLDAVYGAELPAGVRWATVTDGPCPDGWQRQWSIVGATGPTWTDTDVPDRWSARECRPIPAPATVKVRWQDSIGRHLPDGQKIIGADETTISPRIKYGTPKSASYRLVFDGLVEVLALS